MSKQTDSGEDDGTNERDLGESLCSLRINVMMVAYISYTQSNDILPKKIASCITNVSDISTQPMPLYSPSSPPSSATNSNSPPPLLAELLVGYLAMLPDID